MACIPPSAYSLADLPYETLIDIITRVILAPPELPPFHEKSWYKDYEHIHPPTNRAPFPLPEDHILKPTISLSPHYLNDAGGNRQPPPLCLLLANRYISFETHRLYYTLHSFSFVMHRAYLKTNPLSRNRHLRILSPSFSHVLYSIRSLEITILQWSKLDILFQTLSNCIHKGKLRILHVYVTDSASDCWIEDFYHYHRVKRFSSGGLCIEAWPALKGLLEDATLEQARLWACRSMVTGATEGLWRRHQVSDVSRLLDRKSNGSEGTWFIEAYENHTVKYPKRYVDGGLIARLPFLSLGSEL